MPALQLRLLKDKWGGQGVTIIGTPNLPTKCRKQVDHLFLSVLSYLKKNLALDHTCQKHAALQPPLDWASQTYISKVRSTANQICSSLFPHPQLGFEATRPVSFDDWGPKHPLQEHTVTPRRQSQSPKCTNCGSITCHANLRGIFVAASAHCSPPDEPDVCQRPPFPRVWYTDHPLSWPPSPSTTHLTQIAACSLLRPLAPLTEPKNHQSWGSQRGRGP